ncbi:MAG: phage tail protein [Candidatus Peregrinibacteria bacterium]|nr:phage tail protein [Candidatus Peregrinibacteria bacterium]
MKPRITSRFALPLVTAALLFAIVAPVAHGAIRAVGKHKGDYLPAHNFKLEIDGVISGGFKEISGLESEIEVIEFRDGDDPITHKRAGIHRYGNIVLKRGLMDESDELRQWYKKVLAGQTDRKSGSVIYLDRAGQEVLRYNFFEAWPCKWKLPELSTDGSSAATEEIEICLEKIERK